MPAARFHSLRFPSERVLLARTRLAYAHLKNLLSDAKRDRSARVFGYVGVWLPDELLLFYLQEGELVTVTRTRDASTFERVALREAVRTVPTAAEYGSICFHEADDEQLACMYQAQLQPPLAWPEELPLVDPDVISRYLDALLFDGVLEVESAGTLHYIVYRAGRPVRCFLTAIAPVDPVDALDVLWPLDGRIVVRRWGIPAPVTVQPSTALIDLYRALMSGLVATLQQVGVRDADVLTERVRREHRTRTPWLEEFGAAQGVDEAPPSDPVTTAAELTQCVAAWVTDVVLASPLPADHTPESLLRQVTRERRHALQSAGFFDALPWRVR
jgi:hypothetical protein